MTTLFSSSIFEFSLDLVRHAEIVLIAVEYAAQPCMLGRIGDLAATGGVRLEVFEHEKFKLDEVNEALAIFKNRNGGFSNYVICP